jgi:hypothetical protein
MLKLLLLLKLLWNSYFYLFVMSAGHAPPSNVGHSELPPNKHRRVRSRLTKTHSTKRLFGGKSSLTTHKILMNHPAEPAQDYD